MADGPEIARGKSRRKMADPAALLRAAEAAPRLFDIGGYFPALHVMREKGYSWRQLGHWIRGFNIGISHVHLRRLYVQEAERLGRPPGQKTGGPRISGKRGAKLQKEPAKEPPVAAVEPPAVAFQQEDLLRYEGMSGDGPGSP